VPPSIEKIFEIDNIPEDDDLVEADDPEYIVNISQNQSILQDLHELTGSTNISPLKFSYQKRKYKDFKEAFKKRYKEILAPGQEKELSVLTSSSESDEEEVPSDLKFLLQAYVRAETEKQKTLILSAVPKDNYSQADIMRYFSCSKHRVQMARKWQIEEGALNYKVKRHNFRNKLNMDSAEHFLTFLFEGGDLIQDVAYGVSNMAFDYGTKQILPKSILKLSRSHTITEYKKHCEYFRFEPLSTSTLWQILSAIKPGQKHAIAGLDNITTSGISGFKALKQTIIELDLDKETKASLQKDLESSKRYLYLYIKVHYILSTVSKIAASLLTVFILLSSTKKMRKSARP